MTKIQELAQEMKKCADLWTNLPKDEWAVLAQALLKDGHICNAAFVELASAAAVIASRHASMKKEA